MADEQGDDLGRGDPMPIKESDIPRYETAVFSYNEDGPGQYTISVTKLRNPNSLTRSAGWRDGHLWLAQVDGGFRNPTNDIFKFNRRISAEDDNTLIDFLLLLKEAHLDINDIDGMELRPDGELYDPDEPWGDE